jgi:hypothetical protein
MALHELRGSGAPTSAPTQPNQHYVDTSSGNLYISKGTSSSADWTLLSTSSSSVTSFNGRTGAVVPTSGDYTAADVGADVSGAAATVQGNLTTHIGDTANPHATTKAQVGLGNADNTSDVNKPISTATQTALNAKEPSISTGTTAQYWRGDKTFQTLDKTAVGLSNVDNTSDTNKPVSTATQTALNAKVTANTAITGATHSKITYDSKGLVTSGTDMTLGDNSDVILSSPVLADVLRYNGSQWVNAQITSTTGAGSGINYFLTATAAGISGYDIMQKIPDSVAEVDESIAVVSETSPLLFESYISDVEIGHTSIEGGIWNFNVYNYVSSNVGTTYMTVHVYKRTSGGTETQLFQFDLPTIIHTSVELQALATVQPSFSCNTTDKLVFKINVTTSSAVSKTVHLVHSGTVHYTYIETPLLLQHDDLAGLQGGTTAQYYHLTSTEYTGTGSGAFVRDTSPNITTPTGIVKGDVGLGNVDNTSDVNKPVSTAQQTALNLKANLASPALTGVPTAPTATVGTNTTQIATTAFVLANSGTPADATTTTKGIVQLAGDLSGTAAAPTVPGLAGKESTITAGTTAQYWRGDKTFQTLNATAVGLGNVNNTADTAKTIAGDVTGTLGASTVAKLQNRTVASTAPSSGQSLTWNAGTSQWEPATVGGGAGVTFVVTSNVNTSLTSSSTNYQIFTGSTPGQRITMPDATTLSAGTDFFLINKSSVLIPVYNNAATLVGMLYPDQYLEALVTDISTAAGVWFFEQATPISQMQSQLYDDFIASGITSGSIGQLGWTLVAGGGHTVSYVAGTTTEYGVLNMGTGTGIAAGYVIHLGNTAAVVGGGVRINEWRVRFPTLSTSTQEYTTYIGLLNTLTSTAEPTNGIYFSYSRAASTFWQVKTANTTRTTVTSSVTVTANQWYKLALVVNAAGTNIDFYIDGTYVGSSTTNIPTSAVAPAWNSLKTVGATDIAQHIDYVYDIKSFSVLR